MNFDKVIEFRQKYPNIKIEIVSKPIPDLLGMLQSQNLDIVIDSQPIMGEKSKTEIKYLKSYSHCFFTTDKYYTDKPLGIDALNNLPLILSSQSSEEVKLLKNATQNIKLNPVIESWTTESMLKLVREGNGIGYTQEDYIKEDLEKGNLKKLALTFTLPKLDIYCGYITDTLAYAPKKFIEFLISKS